MDILWWILIFIAVMVWIAIAFWPARVAARKGHSFLGYFIFSLFFFPAALLAAYLIHDRTQVPPHTSGCHLAHGAGRRHHRLGLLRPGGDEASPHPRREGPAGDEDWPRVTRARH